MYPSDFASNLETLSLDEIRSAIHHLLDIRDENVWMLFGTLPFYACSSDPDGRSRLNVNIFTGDIILTDFGDIPELGNIQTTRLEEAYENWKSSKIAKEVSCLCLAAACLGPNILVKNSYYQNEDFTIKKAQITKL